MKNNINIFLKQSRRDKTREALITPHKAEGRNVGRTHKEKPQCGAGTILSAIYLAMLTVAIALTLPSCHRNNTAESVLEFSADTVMFDTVFTTITSSTRSFTVHNTSGAAVKVDIALAGGKHSYYSINVDGVPGTEFRNVEIPPHDSLFVFVKVNINPTDQNLPYLVTDSVMFYQKDIAQSVQLVAFGQDAHFIIPDHTTRTSSSPTTRAAASTTTS